MFGFGFGFYFTKEQHKPGRTYGVGLDVGNQYVELIDGYVTFAGPDDVGDSDDVTCFVRLFIIVAIFNVQFQQKKKNGNIFLFRVFIAFFAPLTVSFFPYFIFLLSLIQRRRLLV